MRETETPGYPYKGKDIIPVAVFYDQETAEGNAEGYNLDFKEKGIEGIRFYVACTCSYE